MDAPKGNAGSANPVFIFLLEHPFFFDQYFCELFRLGRLLKSYMGYYHGSRTHLGLGKDAPERRGIKRQSEIIAIPQVGGLHHRYERRVA
jgi:hypothetical protein